MAANQENFLKIKECKSKIAEARLENDIASVVKLGEELYKLEHPSTWKNWKTGVIKFFKGEKPKSETIETYNEEWQCKLCTTLNQYDCVNCISCGQMKGDQYTYEQRERLLEVKKNQTKDVKKREWTCDTCTTLNDPDSLHCSTCEQSIEDNRNEFIRENGSDQGNVIVEEKNSEIWVCQICNTENNLSRKECEICEEPRQK